MKNIARLFSQIRGFAIGIALVFFGVCGLWLCAMDLFESTGEAPLDKQIEAMPDYDYLLEVRELQAKGRLGEAEHLADWVLSGSAITNRDAVSALRVEINRKRTSLWGRSKRAVKGFIVGDGTSIEELGGAVVSDFFLWGDIRDLAKQGYNKVTGKETDPVVAALAAVGVLTSVASFWVVDPAEGAEIAADTSLSFLKTLRKMGHLSNKFCGVIVKACKESIQAKSASKGLKELVVGTKTLFDGVGAARATTVMKHIDDVDSLKAVSKMAKQTAEPTMIIVRTHGTDGIKALGKLAGAEDGAVILEKAARKGAPGIEKLLTYTKYGARAGKSLRHGNLQKFFTKLVESVGRIPVAAISALLILFGLWKSKIWGVVRFVHKQASCENKCPGKSV